jgi:hypothetical protein
VVVSAGDEAWRALSAEDGPGVAVLVQQLQGFIPICAWCRQVRSDGDFWEQVESYLARRSGLFSHAIRPTCRERELDEFRESGAG